MLAELAAAQSALRARLATTTDDGLVEPEELAELRASCAKRELALEQLLADSGGCVHRVSSFRAGRI